MSCLPRQLRLMCLELSTKSHFLYVYHVYREDSGATLELEGSPIITNKPKHDYYISREIERREREKKKTEVEVPHR